MDHEQKLGRGRGSRCSTAQTTTGRTDAELLTDLLLGDAASWPLLVDRHGRRLLTIARSAGLDAAAADDVVQATWLKLLAKGDTIRNGDALHAWLSTVARHEAIRVGRCARRALPDDRAGEDLADGGDGPADRVVRRRLVELAADAMAELPESWATLVRLRYLEGLSYVEIQRRTGVPIGSIGPTVGRALSAVRARMGREAVDA